MNNPKAHSRRDAYSSPPFAATSYRTTTSGPQYSPYASTLGAAVPADPSTPRHRQQLLVAVWVLTAILLCRTSSQSSTCINSRLKSAIYRASKTLISSNWPTCERQTIN